MKTYIVEDKSAVVDVTGLAGTEDKRSVRSLSRPTTSLDVTTAVLSLYDLAWEDFVTTSRNDDEWVVTMKNGDQYHCNSLSEEEFIVRGYAVRAFLSIRILWTT